MILKKKAVLVLHRNHAEYYKEGVTEQSVYQYPPVVISHLEVLNEDELQKQLIAFIQGNKLLPANLVIILSHEILFDKLIPKSTEQAEQIETFRDLVPYESPSVRLVPVPKGTLVLVANPDFYAAFKMAFESQGWNVLGVVPALPYSKDPLLQQPLTQKQVKQVHAKPELLKQYSFLTEFQEKASAEEKDEEKQSQKKRVVLLVGVFGLLMLILIVLIIQMFQSNKEANEKKDTNLTPTPNQQVVSPSTFTTSLPALSPTAPPSQNLSQYQISLVIAPGFSSQATSLQSALQGAGFTKIQSSNETQVDLKRPVVIFDSTVPETVRAQIIRLVEPLLPGVSEQQTTNADSDVTINVVIEEN